MAKNITAFITLSCVFFLMSASAFSQKLPERVCKPSVSGNGTAFLQQVAKRDSVYNWQDKVRDLYGADWANYGTAKVKRFPCNRSGLFAQACVVRAQPCREIEGEL